MSKLTIGLTGGIGSGKTTVSDLFKQLGIDIIDADVVAREVVEPKSKALKEISQHFGSEILLANGSLNRSLLRTKIFSNTNEKEWLNNLLHPLIRERIIRDIEKSTSDYCILSAPLLLENNLNQIVDHVLVIDIDEATQIERVLKRDTSSEGEIKKIIASQISRKKRLTQADEVIDNSSADLNTLQLQVNQLNQKYKTLSQAY